MFNKMGTQLGIYIRSIIINMIAIGTITSLALWVLSIPYPLVLGVFAPLTEAIPLVGPYIGGLPALLLAFSVSPFNALLVICGATTREQHARAFRDWPHHANESPRDIAFCADRYLT